MTEQINIFGYWFLPNKADEKKSGNLRFAPNSNIELEIFGMFGNLLLGPDRYPIILGETNEGPITLIDIWYRRRNDKHSKYQSSFLIKGKHFTRIEDIRFDSCIVDLFGLNFFIKTKHLDFKEIDSVRNWKIQYKAHDVISFDVADTFKGSIKFEGIPSFTNSSEAKIKENIYVKFDYSSRIDFKEILIDAGKFRGFISLINDEVSFPTKIYFRDSDGDKNLEIIHKNIFYQGQTKKWFQPIISFDELENFQELIQNWYREYSEIEHVFNLRLYHYKDKNFFSIDRFIDMSRVLESFHRLRRKNERVSSDDYKEFLKKIEEVELDSTFKRLLNDRLNYGNEPTFKTRLEELFSELPGSIMLLIDEDNKFAKVVKDTRNYYTHYGDELKDKIPSISELVSITDNLESMISFILLKEMGVNKELLATNFSNRGLFKKWKHST